ncbi:MAG TPA: CheR family methyltransferase [Polyangiaceae bacterium]|nr:CheR family methyltransferase [Polyangiaceae bacterium]
MSDLGRVELLKIVGLLEERHGVGIRGQDLPLWLEERLKQAVEALLSARKLDVPSLLAALEREAELVVELANALRVGETRFYRDAAQWEALRSNVIPQLCSSREDSQSLVGLSAGCSTGEEAWTLAMLFGEALGRGAGGRQRARVLGVDRSEAALVVARAATYDQGSGQQLPSDLARRFLQPAIDGSARVSAALMPMVSFQVRDLTRGVPPGRYAIIVCKNVLIYFGDEAQERLAAELMRSLTDDGVLLVARSEVPIVRALGARAVEIAPGITAFKSN